MQIIYTSGFVPYEPTGHIALQLRADRNRKNNEDVAFFGGRRDMKPDGTMETPLEAFHRESWEEMRQRWEVFHHIGAVRKQQPTRVCVQDTFMVPVHDITTLVDYEGRGIGRYTIAQAQLLRMNPGDDLVLDLIQKFLEVHCR